MACGAYCPPGDGSGERSDPRAVLSTAPDTLSDPRERQPMLHSAFASTATRNVLARIFHNPIEREPSRRVRARDLRAVNDPDPAAAVRLVEVLHVNLMYWQLTCECFYTPAGLEWLFNECDDSGNCRFVFFEWAASRRL